MTGPDVARYAYAVGRDLDPAMLAGRVGLREAPLELVAHAGLSAVVSDVPLPEFGEQGLRTHLERIEWLEEVARGHDDVVRAVAVWGPTAPLRLATIFHDDEAVRRRLAEWREPLTEVLDAVDGREEWSVKIVVPPVSEPEQPPVAAPSSGAEFLRRRRAQVGEAEQRQEQSARVAEDAHHELGSLAEASRLLPPQDPRLAGYAGSMVLNAAYLVPHDDAAKFAAQVEQLRERFDQAQVDVGGPWPPYSFAMLEEQ